jgi:hypothetical protein
LTELEKSRLSFVLALKTVVAHPVTVQELLERMERNSLGEGEVPVSGKGERSRSAQRRQ